MRLHIMYLSVPSEAKLANRKGVFLFLFLVAVAPSRRAAVTQSMNARWLPRLYKPKVLIFLAAADETDVTDVRD